MPPLTNAEILALQERARLVARRRKYPQFADDFAQEAAIAAVSGRKATLDQLFIDFLRKEYGRTGSRGSIGGRLKASARHGAQSIDAKTPNGRPLHEVIAAPGGDPEPLGRSWRSLLVLTGRRALIADLYFDRDWSEIEIAESLGITESRVSQMLSPVKKQIVQAALLIETHDLYRDDAEYSKFVVNWIAI